MRYIIKQEHSTLVHYLSEEDMDLIKDALGVLSSDYAGTSALPPDKLARVSVLRRMFA